MKLLQNRVNRRWLAAAALIAVPILALAASPSGAIFTTTPDGGIVNENVRYNSKLEVYLDGGPPPNAPATAAGLDDGLYVFQITDPSGFVLLSQDPSRCRVVQVSGGVIVALIPPTAIPGLGATSDNWSDGAAAKGNKAALDPATEPCHIQDPPDPFDPADPDDFGPSGRHDTNTDKDHGLDADAIVVQMMPYGTTPNPGGVYKAWMVPLDSYLGMGGDLNGQPAPIKGRKAHDCPDFCAAADPGFGPPRGDVKTDNFKVEEVVPPPEITVRKFHDIDGDGVWDADEPEIGLDECIDGSGAIVACPGGWPVDVTDPTGVTNTVYTPKTIVAEPPGTWAFQEATFAKWAVSVAFVDGVSQGAVISTSVDVAGDPSETHEVIFGNYMPGKIHGRKVIDLNGDGNLSGDTCPSYADDPVNNPGCEGVTVKLAGETNMGVDVMEETVTDSNGEFWFDGLAPGTYALSLTEPLGFECSYPSPCNYDGIVIVSGSMEGPFSFGDFKNATKSGTKFHDLNADGDRDADEPGLEGWRIDLAGTDGMGNAVSKTVATDSNGGYNIEVPPGSYTVSEYCPAGEGWRQSLPTPTSDAPADCGTGVYNIVLVSGEADSGNDFGNYKNATKSGRKIHDLNADGVIDYGEPGLPGWKITISGTGGTQMQDTNGAGEYFFSVRPGVYTVSEYCPSGWLQTVPTPADGCGSGVHYVTLPSGYDDTNNDFLNFQPVDVHAHKFFDTNENGEQDEGEGDIEGIEFCITSGGAPVTTDAYGNPVTSCQTTNSGGFVWWYNLLPGTYTVTETVPQGFFPTTDNPQSATLDSGESVTFEFGDIANCVGLTPGYWKNWRNHYTDEQFATLLEGTIADIGDDAANIAEADSILESLGCDDGDALHCMRMFLLANQLTLNLTQHPELDSHGGSLFGACQVPYVPEDLAYWLALALDIHEADGVGYTRDEILEVKTALDKFANMNIVVSP